MKWGSAKNNYTTWNNTLVYQNAGVVVVNSGVVELATEKINK
jgi:hypothetical protein